MSPENKEFKVTSKMKEVVRKFGREDQSIVELIRQEYFDNQNSTITLATAWKCSLGTIKDWMSLMGIEKRSLSESSLVRGIRNKRLGISIHRSEEWSAHQSEIMKEKYATDEEFVNRHNEGVSRSWQDEDKKTKRLVAMHNDRRIQGIQESWDQLSTEDKGLRVGKVAKGLRKSNREKRGDTLGGDPKLVLGDYLEKGLTIQEIAAQIEKPLYVVRSWLQIEGFLVDKRTTLSFEEIEGRRNLVKISKLIGLMRYLLPDDRKVLEMRYGDNGIIELEKIGNELHLTRERIWQKDLRARTILTKMLLGELEPIDGVAHLPKNQKTPKQS